MSALLSISFRPPLATITISIMPSASHLLRNTSRHNRLTRFRLTALPTFFLDTTRPSRAQCVRPRLPRIRRLPEETLYSAKSKTALKSRACRSRCADVYLDPDTRDRSSCAEPKMVNEISGAQTSAPFGPSAIDKLAAFFGGHARTKTVGTCTLEIAGLKCTFHD